MSQVLWVVIWTISYGVKAESKPCRIVNLFFHPPTFPETMNPPVFLATVLICGLNNLNIYVFICNMLYATYDMLQHMICSYDNVLYAYYILNNDRLTLIILNGRQSLNSLIRIDKSKDLTPFKLSKVQCFAIFCTVASSKSASRKSPISRTCFALFRSPSILY